MKTTFNKIVSGLSSNGHISFNFKNDRTEDLVSIFNLHYFVISQSLSCLKAMVHIISPSLYLK